MLAVSLSEVLGGDGGVVAVASNSYDVLALSL